MVLNIEPAFRNPTQKVLNMLNKYILTITSILFCIAILPLPASAVDQQKLDEFSSLMDTMTDRVSEIESGYSLALMGTIADIRRREIFTVNIPEIESIASLASDRSDSNSTELVRLIDAVLTGDPTADAMKSLLIESRVRSVILECSLSGIGADVVSDYVKRESATFVANRGNFFHPEFDGSTLSADDIIRIYFSGFGLVVLVHLDGGIDSAIEMYEESTDLRPYFAQQLVFRGADLDTNGLSLLETVLYDPAIPPPAREIFYGVLAGKLMGPGGQFGNELDPSDTWKQTVAEWATDHIITPERLSARIELPFYGVEFRAAELGPESLLGLMGPTAAPKIASLLASDDPMRQVSGLEAMRWFDFESHPAAADTLIELAEPLMGGEDFAIGILAMNVYEVDAAYTGESYDSARRARLAANLPALIDLMDRAYEDEAIEYLSTTAWLDLFAEGSMKNQLDELTPMIVNVVNADWARKEAGIDVVLPEGEIEILTYFIPAYPSLFTATSDSILGFLNNELTDDNVNPFRVWTYVHYLEAAKSSGVTLDESCTGTIIQLKLWADHAPALIDGDNLKTSLDSLL